MTYTISAKEGSKLYTAAALRGSSNSYGMSPEWRLGMAQRSSDYYAESLEEVMTILLTAFGAMDNDTAKDGDPIALAHAIASRITGLKDAVRTYSGRCASE